MTGPAQLNMAQAKDATPPTAPVADVPLPAIQKAGVYLTWGVLILMTTFLVVMLLYLWIASPPSGLVESQKAGAAVAMDTVRFRLYSADATAFREFWLKIMQMVLLNVLLPVLTALLGYIFGTQSRPASTQQ